MPIVIKELFGSDPLSEALEKINFNFDQIILAGGGPPGPEGPQGVSGVPGPQGDRGDHWQVGSIPPTADHGPEFGSLLQNDLWTSATGQVYAWNEALALWNDTNVNLTGPIGATGPDGGSYEWKIWKGGVSTYRTPDYVGQATSTNWLPSQILPVDDNEVNFIVPVGAGKNSLLLGDLNWTKFNLNNFVGWNGVSPGSFPDKTPKLTLIQNTIDFVGFGGLAIGAYGMTSATGPGTTTSDIDKFSGGLANNIGYPGLTGPTADARNMFYAGLAIKSESPTLNAPQVLSHVFRARTNTIDLEIQAGDTNPTLNAGKSPSVSISGQNSIFFKGLVPATDSGYQANELIRSVIGPTYSRYRDTLYVGFDTSSMDTALSTYVNSISKLIVNGNTKIVGDLYVGSPTTSFNSIQLGYGRTVNGFSEIALYTDLNSNTSRNFYISRSSTAAGEANIVQLGSGNLNISTNNTTLPGFGGQASGAITFFTKSGSGFVFTSTQKAIIKNNGNFGIGTSLDPLVKLHVKSEGEILRLEGSVGGHAFMSFYPQGPSTRYGYIGYPSTGSTDLNIFNENAGGTGRINLATGGATRVTIGSNGNVGIGLGGSSPVGGANNTLQIHNSNTNASTTSNIGFTTSLAGQGFYLRNLRYFDPADNRFQLLHASSFASISSSTPILTARINGSIGINTVDPSSSLHVNGIIKSDLSLIGGHVILSNPDPVTSNGQFLGATLYKGIATYNASGFSVTADFDAARTIVTGNSASTATANTPYESVNYDIQTINNVNGGLSSRISIRGYDGKVGININTPAHRLTVLNGSRGATSSYALATAWFGGLDVGLGIGSYDGTPGLGFGTWIQSIQNNENSQPLFLNPNGGSNGDVYVGRNGTGTNLTVKGDLGLGDSSGLLAGNRNLNLYVPTGNQFNLTFNSTVIARILAGDIRFDRALKCSNSGFQNGIPSQGLTVGGEDAFYADGTGPIGLGFVSGNAGYYGYIAGAPTNAQGGGAKIGLRMKGPNGARAIDVGGSNITVFSPMNITDAAGIELSRDFNSTLDDNEIMGAGYMKKNLTLAGMWRAQAFGQAIPGSNAINYTFPFSARLSVNGVIIAAGTYHTSDMRLKTELARVKNGTALDKILKLSGVLFQWNEKSPNHGMVELGLFAQEVKEVIPEAVIKSKSNNFDDELSLDWKPITTMLIEAVKDQNEIIVNQKDKIQELEDKLSKIEEILAKNNLI
jgi:hypothetical protein